MKKNILLFLGLAIGLIPNNVYSQEDIDIRGQKSRILVYGTPPDPIYLSAEKVVSNKWNIELFPVAGCVVSPQMQDSIEHTNAITYNQLKLKYGESWQVQFYKEIDVEYKKMLEAVNILEANKDFQKILKDHSDLYFTYQLYPILGTSNYDVKVNNIEVYDNRTSSMTYFLIRVNVPEKSINIKNKMKKLNFHYE